MAGQSVGFVDAIKPVTEIIGEVVEQAEAALERLQVGHDRTAAE